MIFTIQLLVSFFVGGLIIALQSLIGERVSLRWRGIILTIPTTTAFGLLFIGWAKTPLDAAHAALFNSAAQGGAYLLVTVFALLYSFGLVIGYSFSLIAWVLFAFLIVIFPPSTFLISISTFVLIPVAIGYIIIRRLPQVSDLKKFPMDFRNIFFRALLGGSVIAISVYFSKTLGNIWGGIFSTFPAVFSSTLVIYYYLQGPKVIPSVAKSMFFPGAIGFPLYVYIASIAFPIYGIWIGTLMAYIGYMALILAWDYGNEILKKRNLV